MFFGLLLLLVFSPDAKAWFLKQLISVGLFKAEIKKTDTGKTTAAVFAFRDEDGNIISTERLKGKVVFINFWATWCPPCRAEMPSLNKLYNQLKDDKRFVFLFMNEDEDLQKAKKFLQSNNYAFPIATAERNVPAERLENVSILKLPSLRFTSEITSLVNEWLKEADKLLLREYVKETDCSIASFKNGLPFLMVY